MDPAQLREVFIKRRDDLHLTQVEIARRVGCSSSMINRMESGDRELGTKWIRPWAKALGLHVEIRVWDPADGKGTGATLAKVEALEGDGEAVSLLGQLAEALPKMKEKARRSLADMLRGYRMFSGEE